MPGFPALTGTLLFEQELLEQALFEQELLEQALLEREAAHTAQQKVPGMGRKKNSRSRTR